MNAGHWITSVIGAAVILAWLSNWASLVQIHEDFVSMKMVTAFGFLSAVLIRTRTMFLPSATFLMVALAWTFGAWYGGATMHDLKVPTETVGPGIPSLSTVACFLLLIAGSLFWHHQKRVAVCCPWIVIGLAGCTLIGYLTGVPALRFYIAGTSTAMAIHTAIAFAIWAVADLHAVASSSLGA